MKSRTTKLGFAAVALYLPHLVWHVVHHSAWDLLWACNVAIVLVALGAFAQNARACVVGFLFLVYGTPFWLLDVIAGGTMVITSPLVHGGGLIVGCLAIRALGWPKGAWLIAWIASAIVVAASYLLSPEEANVNFAFSVYEGWEKHFGSHRLYLASFELGAGVVFYLVEHLATRRRAVT